MAERGPPLPRAAGEAAGRPRPARQGAARWRPWRGSALRPRELVREIGADVVLGTGGYVSAPAVLGARLAGRPVAAAGAQRPGRRRQPLALALGDRGAAVGYQETIADLKCPCLGDRRAGARRASSPFPRSCRRSTRRACWCSAAARARSRSTQAMPEAAARLLGALPGAPHRPPGRRAQPGRGAGRLRAGGRRRPQRRGRPLPRRRGRRHGGEPPAGLARRGDHPRRDLRRRPASLLRAAGDRPGAPGGQRPRCSRRPAAPR